MDDLPPLKHVQHLEGEGAVEPAHRVELQRFRRRVRFPRRDPEHNTVIHLALHFDAAHRKRRLVAPPLIDRLDQDVPPLSQLNPGWRELVHVGVAGKVRHFLVQQGNYVGQSEAARPSAVSGGPHQSGEPNG